MERGYYGYVVPIRVFGDQPLRPLRQARRTGPQPRDKKR